MHFLVMAETRQSHSIGIKDDNVENGKTQESSSVGISSLQVLSLVIEFSDG